MARSNDFDLVRRFNRSVVRDKDTIWRSPSPRSTDASEPRRLRNRCEGHVVCLLSLGSLPNREQRGIFAWLHYRRIGCGNVCSMRWLVLTITVMMAAGVNVVVRPCVCSAETGHGACGDVACPCCGAKAAESRTDGCCGAAKADSNTGCSALTRGHCSCRCGDAEFLQVPAKLVYSPDPPSVDARLAEDESSRLLAPHGIPVIAAANSSRAGPSAFVLHCSFQC